MEWVYALFGVRGYEFAGLTIRYRKAAVSKGIARRWEMDREAYMINLRPLIPEMLTIQYSSSSEVVVSRKYTLQRMNHNVSSAFP